MMFMRSKLSKTTIIGVMLAGALGVRGQVATTVDIRTTESFAQVQDKPGPPRRPATTPTRVIVDGQSEANAPQVVTVVHQLSALKMLRLFFREQGEKDIVARMTEPLPISDVHTNIIAGLAFDDGRTIAVWLPQAAAEIDAPLMFGAPSGQLPEALASSAAFAPNSPNLSVVLSDGRRLRVTFVGLDGNTGISVLRANIRSAVPGVSEAADRLVVGQRMRLVAPQLAQAPANVPPGTVYARIGDAKVALDKILRTSAGKVEHLTATATDLSPAFVGSIALNDAGQTVGIVEDIENGQARLLPLSVVEAAVRRVVGRQASVPRPLLGVRGEPVDSPTSRAFFLAHGWTEPDLNRLMEKPMGILLTSVLPGTPAALANLKPGDVIARINEDEVRTESDFSALLGEAGSGALVNFTIFSGNHPTPESVEVKLGGSFQPVFEKRFFMNFQLTLPGPLTTLGIESVPVSTSFGSESKSQEGLLVVSVVPESVAAMSNVREGDVIELIDGQPAMRGIAVRSQLEADRKHSLSIVRGQQHLQVMLSAPPSKP